MTSSTLTTTMMMKIKRLDNRRNGGKKYKEKTGRKQLQKMRTRTWKIRKLSRKNSGRKWQEKMRENIVQRKSNG